MSIKRDCGGTFKLMALWGTIIFEDYDSYFVGYWQASETRCPVTD